MLVATAVQVLVVELELPLRPFVPAVLTVKFVQLVEPVRPPAVVTFDQTLFVDDSVVPSSVMLMACAKVPSIKSLQLVATTVCPASTSS